MAPVYSIEMTASLKYSRGNKRTSSPSPPPTSNEMTRLTGISLKGPVKKKGDMAKLTKFVARNGFGQEGTLIPVISNHFKLRISNRIVYHYDVEIELLRNGKDLTVEETPQIMEGLRTDRRRGSGEGSMKRQRKLSYHTNRLVIQQLVRQYSKMEEDTFFEVIPVYDGQKNLYVKKPLLNMGTENGRQKRFFVQLKSENGRETRYAVNIQQVGIIDMNAMNMYFKRKATDIPVEIIQAMDIILRHGPNLCRIPIGNSLFPVNGESQRQSLGAGKQLSFGHYQSVRACMSGTTLVIDRSSTAFYVGGNLISFISQVLGHGNGKDSNFLSTIPSLRDYDRKRIERELKNLQVQVTHLHYGRKFRVLGLTQMPAQEVTFRWERDGMDRGMVRITDYFKEEYGKTLNFTNLPCLIVGSFQRKKYLPLEVCELVADQHVRKKLNNEQTATMIRSTASQSPTQRFDVIKDAVNSVVGQSKLYMKEFNIEIQSNPMVVDARILEPPELFLRSGPFKPSNGIWNLDRKRLHESKSLENWIIVNFASSIPDSDVKRFIIELKNSAVSLGMGMDEPIKIARVNCYKQGMLKNIFEKAKLTSEHLKLIMFIIPNDENLYQEIKLVGDVQLGMPTQCIAEKNVRRTSSSLLSNLILKINTKLGGVNVVLNPKIKPSILQNRVMVIGADVTHPSPADKISSSVAAIVGSMDEDCSRYCASVRIQEKCKQEIVKYLDAMMVELLKEYKKQNMSQLPEVIIIYRDGVSEGQFEHVLQEEMTGLRVAFHMIKPGYSPRISIIVVQKRHHTRFMPSIDSDGVGKYQNIPPGTTVDTDVVHPSDFDFFLCSHFGIQGTSRPTHYYVLRDENKLSPDELQKVTYYLCHTYARCTRSISVPAPVQYAHLAAYRARLHVLGINGPDSSASGSNSYRDCWDDIQERERNLVKSLNEGVRLQAQFRNQMYFC